MQGLLSFWKKRPLPCIVLVYGNDVKSSTTNAKKLTKFPKTNNHQCVKPRTELGNSHGTKIDTNYLMCTDFKPN